MSDLYFPKSRPVVVIILVIVSSMITFASIIQAQEIRSSSSSLSEHPPIFLPAMELSTQTPTPTPPPIIGTLTPTLTPTPIKGVVYDFDQKDVLLAPSNGKHKVEVAVRLIILPSAKDYELLAGEERTLAEEQTLKILDDQRSAVEKAVTMLVASRTLREIEQNAGRATLKKEIQTVVNHFLGYQGVTDVQFTYYSAGGVAPSVTPPPPPPLPGTPQYAFYAKMVHIRSILKRIVQAFFGQKPQVGPVLTTGGRKLPRVTPTLPPIEVKDLAPDLPWDKKLRVRIQKGNGAIKIFYVAEDTKVETLLQDGDTLLDRVEFETPTTQSVP